jgi:hypothetical protein
MSAVTREGRRLQILGISLALLNAVLWFCTPAICAYVDEITGRRTDPRNPLFISGVQELFVYFDPWLAHGVFPLIYTVGLAAIPFLKKPGEIQAASRPGGRAYSIVVSLLLIGFEMVWLFLIAVQVFLRGPNWNIFWPGEPWDVHRVVPLNNVNFSEYFWPGWVGRPVDGMPWVSRELPGLVLLGGYFLAGSAIAYGLFRRAHRLTPYWRWAALVLLVQFAALLRSKWLRAGHSISST